MLKLLFLDIQTKTPIIDNYICYSSNHPFVGEKFNMGGAGKFCILKEIYQDSCQPETLNCYFKKISDKAASKITWYDINSVFYHGEIVNNKDPWS
ncbi:MAG TPA: hypothetical protein DCO75_07540 [Fibrobacteres bacterium]|jgi:hypothetical protein|nr:hypothetical protein [Fibrobacterota bacterium]